MPTDEVCHLQIKQEQQLFVFPSFCIALAPLWQSKLHQMLGEGFPHYTMIERDSKKKKQKKWYGEWKTETQQKLLVARMK